MAPAGIFEMVFHAFLTERPELVSLPKGERKKSKEDGGGEKKEKRKKNSKY